jgi:hypothetical protein
LLGVQIEEVIDRCFREGQTVTRADGSVHELEVEEEASAEDLHHWAVLRTPLRPPRRRFDHYVEF